MFDELERNYERRDVYLILFQGAPFFDPYRADPRFQSLLSKMNLA